METFIGKKPEILDHLKGDFWKPPKEEKDATNHDRFIFQFRLSELYDSGTLSLSQIDEIFTKYPWLKQAVKEIPDGQVKDVQKDLKHTLTSLECLTNDLKKEHEDLNRRIEVLEDFSKEKKEDKAAMITMSQVIYVFQSKAARWIIPECFHTDKDKFKAAFINIQQLSQMAAQSSVSITPLDLLLQQHGLPLTSDHIFQATMDALCRGNHPSVYLIPDEKTIIQALDLLDIYGFDTSDARALIQVIAAIEETLKDGGVFVIPTLYVQPDGWD